MAVVLPVVVPRAVVPRAVVPRLVAGAVPLAVELVVEKCPSPQNRPLEAVAAVRLPAVGVGALLPGVAEVAVLGSTHSSTGDSSTT
jgi:hypothetical protein